MEKGALQIQKSIDSKLGKIFQKQLYERVEF